MEGVIVLSESMHVEWTWWASCIIACGVVLILVSYILLIADCNTAAFISGIICVAAIGFGSMFGYIFGTKIIEYKVLIDDSVSLVEFVEKYEILDVEGQIYTVKDKVFEEGME